MNSFWLDLHYKPNRYLIQQDHLNGHLWQYDMMEECALLLTSDKLYQ